MQTNFISSLFAANTVVPAASEVPAAESAPVVLDMASLELVGGGMGPAGTWAALSVVQGPAGTW